MKQEATEKMLEQCLLLREQGKSVTEISALFPDSKQEVEDALSLLTWIEGEGKAVVPPKQMLTNILASLQKPVLSKAQKRQIRNQKLTRFFSSFKILFPVAAFAVLFLMLAIKHAGNTPTFTPEVAMTQTNVSPLSAPSVTPQITPLPILAQNADDLITALLKNSDNEDAVAASLQPSVAPAAAKIMMAATLPDASSTDSSSTNATATMQPDVSPTPSAPLKPLATRRANFDLSLKGNLKSLEDNATGTVQIKAVETFIKATKAAETTRRMKLQNINGATTRADIETAFKASLDAAKNNLQAALSVDSLTQ